MDHYNIKYVCGFKGKDPMSPWVIKKHPKQVGIQFKNYEDSHKLLKEYVVSEQLPSELEEIAPTIGSKYHN